MHLNDGHAVDRQNKVEKTDTIIWLFGTIFVILPRLLYFMCHFYLSLNETADTLGCPHTSPSTITNSDCQNINKHSELL